MSSSHRDAHPYGRSADDVRRRDLRLRRTRRVRAVQLVIFSLLVVGLIAVGVYAVGELRRPLEEPGEIAAKSFGPSAAEMTCPEEGAVPLPPKEVEVTVLNGTSRSGLAGSTSDALAERGYVLGKAGNTGKAAGPVTIVYGPDGYLAAQSVSAQFATGEVTPALKLEASKEGTAVTVMLGDGFKDLAGKDAAADTLAQPVPVPEGC